MTSPSKFATAAAAILGLAVALVGCGSGSDTGTPNTEKIDKEAAIQKQGSVKARAGGGMVEEALPAAPGEKTGMMEGGRK